MNILKKFVSKADKFILNKTQKININKKGLIFLLFHSVFLNKKELESNHIDSQWGFTLDEYKYIFEKFLNSGYIFISHNDLLNFENLDNNKKYAYLHFDDGYFNNSHIVSLLEKYKIYSHFFVVTDNIINNEKFWWDFLFYQYNFDNIAYDFKEINYLKQYETKKIKSYIINKYGSKSLIPKSDIDRPFSPLELKEFSSNKYVIIGNHTSDHSNLNLLNNEDSKKKIINAEQKIKLMIGNSNKIFSFPNSKNNKNHKSVLNSLQFHYAISYNCKNYNLNELNSETLLNLGRYCFVRNKNIDWQIQMCMAKYSPYLILSNFLI